MEKTFGIIKPDAVKGKYTGKILSRIEDEGFCIKGLKKVNLSREVAERFYYVHKDKPFFNALTSFMSSGPSVLMVLEKDNAIRSWRDVMGATDPSKARDGTLREKYGSNIENNAVHGSDAEDTANFEIGFFFSGSELI